MPKLQCHLTLEKIFSRELVKDLLALFFRMSSLNLPLLVAFSGIVLFETVYRKIKETNFSEDDSSVCVRPGSAYNMFSPGHEVTTRLHAQCPFLKTYSPNLPDQQTSSPLKPQTSPPPKSSS